MAKQWQARWICDAPFGTLAKMNLYRKEMDACSPEPQHREDLQHHHWLARTTIVREPAAPEADPVYLDITADDYYKLYINGRFVAQGPAQNDAGHYYYNRIEVGSFLIAGTNAIAVHVYYQGLVNRAYNSGDYRQGLIAELSAGGRLLVRTDSSWRTKRAEEYTRSDSFGYDTQFPEHIDARRSEQGWRQPYFDDSAWLPACESAHTDYTFAEQPTPLLSVYELKPLRVQRRAPGHYWIDFGQELTGQFCMEAEGEAGAVIEVRCGEELEADGLAVRFDMRCNCTYQERWTLSGARDRLEPYDYKGFRYVEVFGPEAAIQPDSFHAIVRHYPLDEESCLFQCSDERMNGIFQICKTGVKLGAQENYVDCPTREKGQYLGDNTVIGHSHMLLSGDMRLYKKAIEQFALSSATCPGLMAVVPGHLMQEIADFSLQWPLQLLEYYRYSGDLDFARDMYPYAERLLRHFQTYNRGDGLLHNVADKWNLVDWPKELRDDYDFELTRPVGPGCHNVVNALYLGCIQAVNELRELLGIADDADKSDWLRLRQNFIEAFYDPASRLFTDAPGSRHHALHSNVLPLLFGLAPVEAIPSIVQLIRDKRFSCGVYFAYFVLKALARVGEHSLLYELMDSEEERSWGNMLNEGATACFEAWGKEQKWNTSLCHAWASAPVPLLIEEIIGLKPSKPGWTEISFAPRIPPQWEHCTLQLRVPAGWIRLAYSQGQWQEDFPKQVRVVRR
ncbi:family 78 glycoside hydrolase catalytic domain [Cohnella fermenti]|uniref:alpha-L-rhamnosidase n=1 Tax=Cohnella fermenti TaxID=2565925 RepID=A0A4S4BGQ6_9BACL|nr:family 78 glycoside hydrolase catalytic domain [Cohnella fermenti]THF73527.1 alpha-L-rhamnosidase [Cohnella fermenti]